VISASVRSGSSGYIQDSPGQNAGHAKASRSRSISYVGNARRRTNLCNGLGGG